MAHKKFVVPTGLLIIAQGDSKYRVLLSGKKDNCKCLLTKVSPY